jgi:peptidoglycan/LPS O-acetylase OafA/YrhL
VKKGQYRLLDAWRGIASLAVVFYHWAGLAEFRMPELKNDPLYSLSHFGSLGVQIFFVISGYCIVASAAGNLRKEEGIPAYLWARVRRVYPTYWAAFALMVAFMLTASWMAAHGLMQGNIFSETNILAKGPLAVFSNLTLTMLFFKQPQFLSVAWTLCYEVAFYAIVGVALAIALRLPRPEMRAPLMMSLLHGLTAVLLTALIIAPDVMPFPLGLWPQFGLGVLVYDMLSRPGERAPRLWAAAIFLLLTVFVLTRDTYLPDAFAPSRLTFATTGIFAGFLLLAYRYDSRWSELRFVRLLGVVGLYSYSLYLTHMLTIRVVNQGVKLLHIPATLHYLVFAAAVAASLGAAYLFYRLFEKPIAERKKTPAAQGNSPVTVPAAIASPIPSAMMPGGTE